MDAAVHLALRQILFEFAGEQALRADLRQRVREVLVAGGLVGDQLGRDSRLGKTIGDLTRLSQRQFGRSRRDANDVRRGHGRLSRSRTASASASVVACFASATISIECLRAAALVTGPIDAA